MKKAIKFAAFAIGAAYIAAAGLSACRNAGKCTVLAEPARHETVTWQEKNEPAYADIVAEVNDFSARFAGAVYDKDRPEGNFALSPVSVYMALSMAAQCAGGEARAQVLAALGSSQSSLEAGYGYLWRSLNEQFETGCVSAANSVWLQEGVQFNENCVRELAEKYYCYSYAADFRGDNANANAAVRNFAREHTDGMIDKDFALSEDTCFALVNALYLKDNWNLFGDELFLTDGEYDFMQGDGSVRRGRLMRGGYSPGRAVRGSNFTTFYISTHEGYRLHFIVPDDGVKLSEAFNAEAISFACGITDYGGEEGNKLHYTRCIFPQFSASFDGDVLGVLRDDFGIVDIFDENASALTSLLPGGVNDFGRPVWCSRVQHVAKLQVDRRGLKGAAVTVIVGDGATDPGPTEKIYHDFVVDRAFGYIVTDGADAVLFAGAVNKI